MRRNVRYSFRKEVFYRHDNLTPPAVFCRGRFVLEKQGESKAVPWLRFTLGTLAAVVFHNGGEEGIDVFPSGQLRPVASEGNDKVWLLAAGIHHLSCGFADRGGVVKFYGVPNTIMSAGICAIISVVFMALPNE